MNTLLVIMLASAALLAVTGDPHTEVDPPVIEIPMDEPHYIKPYQMEQPYYRDQTYHRGPYYRDQPYYRHDGCEDTKQELRHLAYKLTDLAHEISALSDKRNTERPYYPGEKPYYPGEKPYWPTWLREKVW